MDIDWAFIARLEGGQRRDGYIPKGKEKSGVTVATGVDLGQHSAVDLNRMGVPPELKKKLTPYLLKSGSEAARLLEKHPLRLTLQEAIALDRAVKSDTLRRFVRKYDQAIAADGIRFQQLPHEVQTVIASVVWQYGVNIDIPANNGGAPKFWRLVTAQDWQGTYDELMNFSDPFGPRRRQEGGYLKRWLDRQPVD